MPSASPLYRSSWRALRLAGIAALVTLVFAAAAIGPGWLRVLMPPGRQFHALIALLRAARWAYIAILTIEPAALTVLAVWVIRIRGRGPGPRWPAQGLALCLALLIAVVGAEAAAAVRLEQLRVPMPRLPYTFPDPLGDRVVDIVVLGESSAYGVPYHDWLSVGEIVAWKLREALPRREFAVNCLAKPGLKLDEVHQLLGTLERRPDLVILYAGHNEFSMRYHWAHGARHYRDETPPDRVTWQGLVGGHSPVCRLFDATISLFLRASPPTRAVERQLVDVPVYTAAEYAERLHDFRTRLEAMCRYCERVGATVVLVIPPGNDADFEPSRSFLPPGTPRAEREAFAREFAKAQSLEETDPPAAMAAYRRLLERQPGFAETHYRLARLEEKGARPSEANAHYIAARDCDGLPLRCTSDFQDAYREVAARHPRAILVDGPAVLRALSPRAVVGDEFFTDGFHPSLAGYTGLAAAILRGLRDRGALGLEPLPPGSSPVVTTSECARHFEMDAKKWVAVALYSGWFYGHAAFLRFDPADRTAKSLRYGEAAQRIEQGIAPEQAGVPGIGASPIPASRLVSRSDGPDH